jgi:hypothetical protein
MFENGAATIGGCHPECHRYTLPTCWEHQQIFVITRGMNQRLRYNFYHNFSSTLAAENHCRSRQILNNNDLMARVLGKHSNLW